MTLLDVIDLDKIWRLILCKKTIFFSHGRNWTRLWFGIYKKIKIIKKKKTNLLNMKVPKFLYTNSMLLLLQKNSNTQLYFL